MSNILDTWVTLNKGISTMSEKELEKLMIKERNGENRFSFLIRIQGRINALAAKRKLAKIMKERK